MNFITSLVVCVAAMLTCAHAQPYHGILMDGFLGGTQIYDPFNSPHAQGDLSLGLQAGTYALLGAAVIDGQVAYFCGRGEFECRLLRIFVI